jgi:hypothetical protein
MVTMKAIILCMQVEVYCRFGGTDVGSAFLRYEVNFYHTTRGHIQEQGIHQDTFSETCELNY